MSKNVVVIFISLIVNSNFNALFKEFARGVKKTGHDAEYITMRSKNTTLCVSCLACQTKGQCILTIMLCLLPKQCCGCSCLILLRNYRSVESS